MTFNDNAKIDSSKVSKRGRNTGVAVGGGGLVVVGLFVLSQLLGVDLTGLAPLVGGGSGGGSSQSQEVALECNTGADANENVDCLMAGAANSLDAYWAVEGPKHGIQYVSPADFVLFSDQTNTGCGTASSATGPFYCPPDQSIYLDTAFYDDLRSRFGASGGSLSQMYVVAHEWGHHIQNISGIMDNADRSSTGPASDTVRIEVQADCFAGAWAAAASKTTDVDGVSFLKPITQTQINDALNAAAAIGDDRIQEMSTGQVQPETWTHGSSDMRQRWFMTGFNEGAGSCDTFSIPANQL